MKPKRLQMRRTKGWRKPEGAIYCGRPGLLGNPFPVGVYGQEGAVALHRGWLEDKLSVQEMSRLLRSDKWSDPSDAVSLSTLRQRVLEKLPALRGQDLLCWCKPGTPCHVDTLIDLANK